MFNEQSHLPERGGFWRRFGALVVDALIIAVGLQLLAGPAYQVSGGRVQSSILGIEICYEFDVAPPGLKLPPGLRAQYVSDCVEWFGLPTARWVMIWQRLQPQPGSNTAATYPIDAEGNPLSGFWLDLRWLHIPLLLVFRIGCEREHGQTTGKRLMRVRVVQIVPGSGRFSAAAKRNLALFLPLIFPGFLPVEMPPWFVLITVGIFCGTLCTVAIWQITTRRDTYYDKAAGTAVVRVDAHLPPVIVHASPA